MTADLVFGDFGHRTIVGAYRPDLSTMEPDHQVFGLNQQIQWLYGFLRDGDGIVYVPERKFNASLTGGLFLMSGESGTLNVNHGTGRSARGELRRIIEPDHRRWHEPVFQRLPSGIVRHDEQPFLLDLTNDRIEYGEGDLLQLEGPSAGLGVQFLDASRFEPLFYSSLCFWVQGEVLGKAVEGPIFFDSTYWRHGHEWKECRHYKHLQVGWHVFANKYEDGSVEWGHLVVGREGFTPAVVVEGDRVVCMSPNLRGSFCLDDDDWVTSLILDVDGHEYEFCGHEAGFMEEFSKSRWANYRAQYGQTRRRGDSRPLRDGFTWLECFADRIRDEGLVK